MKDMISFKAVKGRTLVVTAILLTSITIASVLIMGGCGKEKISLDYSSDPEAVILSVESGGGMPFPGDDLSPLFQLFGDGRVVKYQGEPGYQGMLVQGKLGEEDMVNLLKQIYDTGFFELEDEYQDVMVTDAVFSQISVDLAELEKTVRVWMMNDVPQFEEAYDLIMNYPLGEVNEYVPDTGYLVVVRYPLDASAGYEFVDPASDIYQLLPDTETLNQAADSHTAVAIDGGTLLQLIEYDNQHKYRGLYISQPDGYLVVYPVYEPRTAELP